MLDVWHKYTDIVMTDITYSTPSCTAEMIHAVGTKIIETAVLDQVEPGEKKSRDAEIDETLRGV